MIKEKEEPKTILVCPKCKKKVMHKGLKISADLECKKEWDSKIEDFSIAIQSIKVVLICKKCQVGLTKDSAQTITVPTKKLIVPK